MYHREKPNNEVTNWVCEDDHSCFMSQIIENNFISIFLFYILHWKLLVVISTKVLQLVFQLWPLLSDLSQMNIYAYLFWRYKFVVFSWRTNLSTFPSRHVWKSETRHRYIWLTEISSGSLKKWASPVFWKRWWWWW